MSASHAETTKYKICAITTFYHAELNVFKALLSSTLPQVDTLVIVNNGGDIDSTLLTLGYNNNPKITILTKNQNIGTAGAFNLGAEWAFNQDQDQSQNQNYTHLLLLDQDSQPHPDMVNTLLNQLIANQNLGLKVAVIGPQFIYKNNNHAAAFVKHEGLFVKRISKPQELPTSDKTNRAVTTDTVDKINQTHCIQASYIISSGSLIPKQAWLDIGPNDEGLFLDLTDIEWGLRAGSKGYKILASYQANMYHQIGFNQYQILNREINQHSPIRRYYSFRNCINLAYRQYIPLNIRLNFVIKLIPRFFIYLYFSENKTKQAAMMIKGIWHGIKKVQGPYEN